MTAVLFSDTVTDTRGRPVAAAQVFIYNEDGSLVELDEGNPLTTDSLGAWSAELEPGLYHLIITRGDDYVERDIEIQEPIVPVIPVDTMFIQAVSGVILCPATLKVSL